MTRNTFFESRTAEGQVGHDEWLTPPSVLDLVRKVGIIGLDPFATKSPHDQVKAKIKYQLPRSDGLKLTWKVPQGLTFANPPFMHLRVVSEKLLAEKLKGAEIILLAPIRADTIWFKNAVEASSAICFLPKRLRFLSPVSGQVEGTSMYPSGLFYIGKRLGTFHSAMKDAGWVVKTRWE